MSFVVSPTSGSLATAVASGESKGRGATAASRKTITAHGVSATTTTTYYLNVHAAGGTASVDSAVDTVTAAVATGLSALRYS